MFFSCENCMWLVKMCDTAYLPSTSLRSAGEERVKERKRRRNRADTDVSLNIMEVNQ